MEKLDELGHWPTATWFQQRLIEVRIKALRPDWEKKDERLKVPEFDD